MQRLASTPPDSPRAQLPSELPITRLIKKGISLKEKDEQYRKAKERALPVNGGQVDPIIAVYSIVPELEYLSELPVKLGELAADGHLAVFGNIDNEAYKMLASIFANAVTGERDVVTAAIGEFGSLRNVVRVLRDDVSQARRDPQSANALPLASRAVAARLSRRARAPL